MLYNIYRNSELLARVKPLDSSELQQRKQEQDVIRLNFELDFFEQFQIGDYIAFEKNEQLYKLNKLPRVTENPKHYQYECIFEGDLHDFEKVKCFLETPKILSGSYIDYKFSLTGNAKTFLDFIVENLNRIYSGYAAGVCEDTDVITVDFNNWNVYESISAIAELLNFEWYLDGKTLNFKAPAKELPLVFSVGRGQGFVSLNRLFQESAELYTVLWGYGSTENLPEREDFDSSTLKENRLFFYGDGGQSKLSKNVDKYGVIEQVKEYDIKPQYFGEITALSDDINGFFDSGINFDVNEQKLPNVDPKIVVTSGLLNGRKFNINFDNSSKKVTLTPINEDSGTFPNELIKLELGDTYVFIDISLPSSYITDAQNRLEEAVQIDLDDNSKPKELYDAEVDEYHIQNKDIKLYLGDLIRVVSAQFAIDNLYEIKELIQNINNPYKYSLKFGDLLPKSLLASLRAQNFETQQEIYNISNTQITSNDVTNIIGDEVVWDSL